MTPSHNDAASPSAAPEGEVDADKKLVADAGRIGGATFLIYFLNLLGGLLLPKILVPADFGVWRLVQLTLSYTHFFNLGLSHALDRTGATLLATGRLRRYQKLMGVCIAFSLLLPIATTLGFFLSLPWTFPLGAGPLLIVLAVAIPLQQLQIYAEISLMMEKRYGLAAQATLLVTAFRIIVMVVLALLFGLPGALLGFLVSTLLNYWILARKAAIRLYLSFKGRTAWRLWKEGAPITAILLGDLLLSTLDKWVVPIFLGAEQNGFYGMAVFPLPILGMIALAFRQVSAVEIYDRYQRERSLTGARQIYARVFLVIALTYPLLAGAACFGLPMLIHLFLPKYVEAIPALLGHTILVYPLLLTPTGLVIMIVLRMEWRAFAWQCLLAIVSTGISVWAVTRRDAGLLEIVMIHGAIWLIYGFGMMVFVQRQFGERWFGSVVAAAKYLFPVPFMAIVLAVEWVVLTRLGLAPHSIPFAFAGGALHLLACAPLFWYLERKTQALSDAWRKVAGKLSRSRG